MKNKKEITIGIRLASMLLDHLIMTFAMFIPMVPFMIYGMKDLFEISHEPASYDPSYSIYGFIIGFAFYFNKDFFNGRGPAKRILKMQVVNNKTHETASSLKCLIRNLTIVLWPIEVIFTLVNPSRRLGDYIAGTRIEMFDASKVKVRAGFKDYLLPLAISLLFTYALSLPFMKITESFDNKDASYIESSFNEDKSAELSSFLSYRLKSFCDSANIHVYDKIENDRLKYVSLLFYVNNDDILDNTSKFNSLKRMIVDTLDLKIPKNTFMLSGKIIYKVPGSIHIKYMNYSPRDKTELKATVNADYINDSTKVITAYFDNGQIESETYYVRGKLYGTSTEWYKNGNVKSKIEYKNGMRNGITTDYYTNGQKKSELLYQNNNYVKDINRWNKDGSILQTSNE